MGRFKKGLFLGTILGAGLAWLNTTPKGKQARKKIVDASSQMFEELKKEIEKKDLVGKINKTKYGKMVNTKVKDFVKKNPWAESMADELVKKMKSEWVKVKSIKK